MNHDILVAGGTGRTGQLIVAKLIQRGLTPHLIARDAGSARKLFGGEVIFHKGDVRRIETLLPAMKDIATVISAVGTRVPVGKNCPRRVDYEGIANLVRAARLQGVHRFILISSIAVTRRSHPVNHFGGVLDWKFRGEETLRKSGLTYTIVRPGGLMDSPENQHRLQFLQGDRVLGMISRASLAETCIQALQYAVDMNVTFEVIENDRTNPPHWSDLFSSLTPD